MTRFIPKNPEYLNTLRQEFDQVPYHRTMNTKLGEAGPGYVTVHLPWQEGFAQQDGYYHAGVLISLADAAAGAAAYTLMAPGERLLSVNFAVSLLRSAKAGRIRAEGRVIKAGKRLYFCEAELYPDDDSQTVVGGEDSEETLLVKATITMSVA